jgi:hypothetical protein
VNTLKSGKSKGCLKCKNVEGKIKDISGQIFCELKALEYNRETSKWKCQCSCGKIKEIRGYDLTSGKTRSCGDRKKHNYRPSNFIDLTGEIFGDRTVIKYDGYTTKSYWICRCICGKEERLSTQSVKNNYKCKHNTLRYIDITGKKFGKLTALKRARDGKWLCECECGERKLIYSSNLRSGGTTSCKCNIQTKLNREECIDKINKFINKYESKPSREELEEIFGVSKAIVRKYIDRFELSAYIDNKFRSKQERYIAKYLIEHGLNIETNSRKIVSGYEIDIYIPEKKIAIEFNGNYWHSELFKDMCYHQNKSLACIKADIDLVHIFEYNFDDIDNILDSIINGTYNSIVYTDDSKIDIEDLDTEKHKHIKCPLYKTSIDMVINRGFKVVGIDEPEFVLVDNKYNKVDKVNNDADELYRVYNEGCIEMIYE